ncbi:hypothetical protein INR49_003362, partial [Caranx melampygus]
MENLAQQLLPCFRTLEDMPFEVRGVKTSRASIMTYNIRTVGKDKRTHDYVCDTITGHAKQKGSATPDHSHHRRWEQKRGSAWARPGGEWLQPGAQPGGEWLEPETGLV